MLNHSLLLVLTRNILGGTQHQPAVARRSLSFVQATSSLVSAVCPPQPVVSLTFCLRTMAEESKSGTPVLSVIAQPLASEKLQKKLFKVVKKGTPRLRLCGCWVPTRGDTACGGPTFDHCTSCGGCADPCVDAAVIMLGSCRVAMYGCSRRWQDAAPWCEGGCEGAAKGREGHRGIGW